MRLPLILSLIVSLLISIQTPHTAFGDTGQKNIEICRLSQNGELLKASPAKKAQYIEGLIRRTVDERFADERLPDPSYFVVYDGNQGKGNEPPESHTFATYILVSSAGQKWTTTSWLPADFSGSRHINVFKDFWGAIKLRLFGHAPEPVPGKNFTVRESLTWAQEPGKALAVYYPLRISKKRYEAGIARKHELDTNIGMYAADDEKFRPLNQVEQASNCIHAVSDAGGCRISRGGLLNSGWRVWGIAGTRHVVKEAAKSDPDGFYDKVDLNGFWLFTSPD